MSALMVDGNGDECADGLTEMAMSASMVDGDGDECVDC